MFQALQVCETGDTHDVLGRHLVDKYQSFYRNCCLHYQCRISQRLILILKQIIFATDSLVAVDRFLHILQLSK
jgi:hypothetical protein